MEFGIIQQQYCAGAGAGDGDGDGAGDGDGDGDGDGAGDVDDTPTWPVPAVLLVPVLPDGGSWDTVEIVTRGNFRY